MNFNQVTIIRSSTVAMSLDLLLKGQLRYLNNYYHIIAVSGKDDHLHTVESREGVPTISVTFSRPINLIQDIKSLWALYRVLRKEKPTIIHSITPKAGLLSMVAGKLAGVPIRMHTFTGLVFPYKNGVLQKVLIAMDKVLCACATHIYPEGQGVKNDLQRFGITSKPLKIIANGNVNGVDLQWFHPSTDFSVQRKDYGIEQDEFVFIFVGRLVKDKGIEELIEAFQSFQSKGNSAKLLLVGPLEQELDPLTDEVLKMIQTDKQIITTGYQHDIRPFLNMADVFVFPSHREGFPNVVLQAGAMGLPTIVTNISGSNEIIQHGYNGLITEVRSVSDLLDNMMLLYTDDTLRAKLASVARTHIAVNYSQEVVWEELKKEYDLLLSNV